MRIKRETEVQKIELGRLGKIKVGELKESNGKTFPSSIDYFRFTSGQADRVERMRTLFGDKPTSVRITFHSDSIDDVCSNRFELRNGAGQLMAYGDGEKFKESVKEGWVDRTKAEVSKLKGVWQEILILKFIVLGFPEIGYWEFATKAKETTIPQVVSTFDLVLSKFGRVTMVPFRLTVEKHKSNRANANRSYPVVNLICDLSVEAAEQLEFVDDRVKGLLTMEKLQQVKQIAAPVEDGFTEAVVVE